MPDGEALVREAIEAFERADADAFAACFDPQAEFRLPRNLIEGGSYYGRAGARRAVADAYETWSEIDFDVEDVRETEDLLVVHALVRNVPRGGGPTVDYQATYDVRVGEAGITYWSPQPT